MAQVVRPADIDYHLDYQFNTWRNVPEYAEWWPTMDVVDKEVFHLEWIGITESRLQELQRWAGQGLLTPYQQARYDELMKLVDQNQAAVDAMLQER